MTDRMPKLRGSSLWEEGRRYVLEVELQEVKEQLGQQLAQLDAVISYLCDRLGIPVPLPTRTERP